MNAAIITPRLRYFLFFVFGLLLFPFWSIAQVSIGGRVIDRAGKPVSNASVSLENTLDGSTTDSAGLFNFTTTETGSQVLVTSLIGQEDLKMPLNIQADGNTGIIIKANNKLENLEGVTVSAGSINAGGANSKALLTSLDIVTTAGANADVVRAIQTLPGTQQQGNQTGLFVRGGDASEAVVVIDGLVAQNAFQTSAPGVAARSRFSPFQYKGISFSSGGYSARYGQALSSVLELNTLDLAERTTVNLGINMSGLYASGTKLWKNSSGGLTANYTNLTPFYGLAKTNVEYYDVPKGAGLSGNYIWKPNSTGILKILFNSQQFSVGTRVPDPSQPGSVLDFGVKNTSFMGNINYQQLIKSKWTLYTAASYSYNKDDIHFNTQPIPSDDYRMQGRAEVKRTLARKLYAKLGTELQHYRYQRNFDTLSSAFTENATALYLEGDWSPAYWFSIQPGLRYERSQLLDQNTLAPRLALAFRTGKYSQVSLASGVFYQTADLGYLLNGYRPKLQEALHYIANYQYSKDDRILRVEAYYKDYQHLVREQGNVYDPNSYRFSYLPPLNNGHGYAKGAELFWRDKKLIKHLDYWISYSYIDTRRLYKNFVAEATPTFISDHNLNVIAKYWLPKINSQVNMTYGYASGRPYYNPNSSNFLADRTSDYHNLSVTFNWLTNVKKWFTVVYAGVDNVTNRKNVFGYRYSTDGKSRFAQYPAIFRSVFVGANFSLTEFSKDEI